MRGDKALFLQGSGGIKSNLKIQYILIWVQKGVRRKDTKDRFY